MTLKVVRDIGELKEFAAGWNEILRENGDRNPFLTPEWIVNWWSFFGNTKEPYVLVLLDGNVLAGLCPLMVIGRKLYKEIQFIGRPQVSRMGLVARRGYEESFVRRIADHLVGLKGRYMINLEGFRCDDSNYHRLKYCLQSVRYTERMLPLYRIDLSNIPQQDFFRVRKRHSTIRQTLSREKSLSRQCRLVFERATPEEVPGIFAMHDKRWQRKNDGNGFAKGVSRDFFEYLAQNASCLPWDCQIHLLKVDDKSIGFIYGILYRGSYIAYRIAHDNDFGLFKPGMMLFKRMIEECYAKECDLFDFSTGDEQYKTYWTDDQEQIASLCFGVGPLTRWITILRHRVYLLRQAMKKVGFLVRFKRNTIGEIRYLLSGRPILDCLKRIHLAWQQKKLLWLLGHGMSRTLGEVTRVYPTEHSKTNGKTITFQALAISDMEQIMDLTGMDGKRICKRYMGGDRCVSILANGALVGYIWKTVEPLTQGDKTLWKPKKQGDACYYDLCLYRVGDRALYRAVFSGIGNEPPCTYAAANYLLLHKRQHKMLMQAQNTQRAYRGKVEAR